MSSLAAFSNFGYFAGLQLFWYDFFCFLNKKNSSTSFRIDFLF